MHPRRTARESILGALYAYELTGEEKNKVLLDVFERNSFDEETKYIFLIFTIIFLRIKLGRRI